MLRSLKDLEHYTVRATDGDVGSVVNFLLDDEHWVVRYLVVRTTGASGPPRVLISPMFFRRVEWETHTFGLALTEDKVRNSPSIDVDRPVSRQHERDYYGYYGYPHYWGYLEPWGTSAYPALFAVSDKSKEKPAEHYKEAPGDVHLRSASEVRGYHIQGSDDAIGHVEDFIIDDESWEVRYLAVDTKNWWFGKKVLVSSQWTSRVSWPERKVYVDLTRDAIKKSPEWNPGEPVNREYETRLYDYYGRPVYWYSNGAGTPEVESRGTASRLRPGEPTLSHGATSTRDKGR